MLACGREPTPQTCLAFAVAGFASVALAPGLGLPPELPGSEAAPLAARQAWWVMTAAATGMGLYLIAMRRSLIAILGGLVLLIAPHVAGAPQAPSGASELPRRPRGAVRRPLAGDQLRLLDPDRPRARLGLAGSSRRDAARGTARA